MFSAIPTSLPGATNASTPSATSTGPPAQMGQEKRQQILPSQDVSSSSFKQPDYNPAGQVLTPDVVGVKRGGSFGDVYNAARGMAYYTDVIAFGQSSREMTKGLPFNKIGLNYLMPSGLTCSNGADMWTYFEGIPKGDAMGKRVDQAMVNMGLPRMTGLAPGIVEDTQAALNPMPILQAAFGNVYPVCEKKALPVGDDWGRIMDDVTGDKWIEGPLEYRDGRPYQTKWVQAMEGSSPIFISQQKWRDTPKTMNPDGSPKTEGFEDGRKASLLLAVVLFSLAFAVGGR